MQGVMPEEPDIDVSGGPQKPSQWVLGLYVILALGGIATGTVVTMLFHPLRAYETGAITVIMTSPFWVGAALGMQHIIKPHMRANPKLESFNILSWVSMAALALSVVYFVNSRFDDSAEQVHELPLTGKNYSTSKNGKRYYATVQPFTPSRLTFLESLGGYEPLDKEERIPITQQEYITFDRAFHRARIVTKSGALGIPWEVSAQIEQHIEGTKPASMSFPPTNYDVGMAYFKAKDLPDNNVKSVEYLTKAAEAGDANAQHDLAYMYSYGLGVKQDWVKANEWLLKSAEQGNALAQDDLGVSYGDGRGIEQDWVKSYMWIDLSAKQGYPQAIKDLDYAKARMTPEQIEKAKALSAEWKPAAAAQPFDLNNEETQ